jgi:hypothetical protein
MLRINQLKLKVGHSEEQLKKKLVRELKIRPEELQKFEIRRQSPNIKLITLIILLTKCHIHK